jgi:arginine deiminase
MSTGSSNITDNVKAAAYGGEGWSPRSLDLRQEIGEVWSSCGIDTEWAPLKAVLLHRPGEELDELGDPDSVQMLAPGRPASTVRAGEERLVARRLAALGVPILRTIRGKGTFEGADAAWIDPETVLLTTGLRTNAEGAHQVTALLREMGVEVVRVGLPYGTMHLMGQLRFGDRDLAIAWPGRVPYAAVEALRGRGYEVLLLPSEGEAVGGFALNFVTLGPRSILMTSGNPVTQTFYEDAGITCHIVEMEELLKAAGGIGCLTGILERQLSP